jgi:GTP-binding protein Era
VNKTGFITIVGKPNSGKSTLLNNLIGAKIAIASPRKNTTRNQIKGIRNDEDSQLIFIDTPGFIKRNNLLDEKMHDAIRQSMEGVDIILYLIPF